MFSLSGRGFGRRYPPGIQRLRLSVVRCGKWVWGCVFRPTRISGAISRVSDGASLLLFSLSLKRIPQPRQLLDLRAVRCPFARRQQVDEGEEQERLGRLAGSHRDHGERRETEERGRGSGAESPNPRVSMGERARGLVSLASKRLSPSHPSGVETPPKRDPRAQTFHFVLALPALPRRCGTPLTRIPTAPQLGFLFLPARAGRGGIGWALSIAPGSWYQLARDRYS